VPHTLKLPASDVKESIREARKAKSPFRNIHYIDPFVLRARAGYELSQRMKELFMSRSLDRKIAKLASTNWGRAYISKNVVELAKKYATEKVDIINAETGEKIAEGTSRAKVAMLRRELKELNKMNVNSKEYMARLKEILDKNLGEDVSKRIMARMSVLVHEAYVGRRGIINPGRAAYAEGDVVKVVDYDIKDTAKIKELAKNVGLFRTPSDYFKHKDALLLAEAIEKTSNVHEALNYYEKRFMEELAKDPYFRRGFEEYVRKEIIKMYNLGATLKLSEELMKTLPAYLISMTSRMISSAVRRLPIVGDVAAVQYEAAAAVSELGNKLSDKVESAAQMHYTLSSLLPSEAVNEIEDSVSRQLHQAPKEENN